MVFADAGARESPPQAWRCIHELRGSRLSCDSKGKLNSSFPTQNQEDKVAGFRVKGLYQGCRVWCLRF